MERRDVMETMIAECNEQTFDESRRDDHAQTRKTEQEEIKEVTKKIAGKMFALVKEKMEQSGFLDAASLVKEHLNKSCSEEQSTAKR